VTLALITLNGVDYLPETLACVLGQDYPNVEILVSDNGSSDGTAEVIKSLAGTHKNVAVRRNELTVPFHEHANQCLSAANGEYFILLGDDDRINEAFVSALVDVALNHRVSVVVPANATIDSGGEVLERCEIPPDLTFDGPELVNRWLYGRPPRLFANVTTVLVRTELLRQIGGYRELAGGRNCDNLLFLQCAIRGRVGFARSAIFNWRIYPTSYGSRASAQQVLESGRQFIRHVQRDANTQAALARLPKATRTSIVNGVRMMTAMEFVYQLKLRRAWVLLTAMKHRRDLMFWFVVLRQSYRWLKRSVVVPMFSPFVK
jgi:glycosyltransferase involved in cell wall biosynthesis